MEMSYTKNPNLPRVRMQAVLMVRRGISVRKTARYFGYSHAAVLRWIRIAPRNGRETIPTRSSRPKYSPKAIGKELVGKIIKARIETKRCSEVVCEKLKSEGIEISLSSVKRTLSRYGLLNKRSPWKKRRSYPPRPDIKMAGDMVEMDTIHLVDRNSKKTYVYTAIDIYSRYGFAMLSEKVNTYQSILFAKKTQKYFDFKIKVIQTDNGPEFQKFFSDFITRNKIQHRHIHPRSPNENGHLERFNRTIQEEIPKHNLCIHLPEDIKSYLKHYNEKRMHMSLNFKTPTQKIQEVVTRS